jgi:predicted small secreted protein
MRVHRRVRAVAPAGALPGARIAGVAALLALAMGVTSCETLSGSGKSGAALAESKEKLTESRAALNRAAQDGDLQGVGTAMRSIGSLFDTIESKSSAMNLMDRENMAIQIATGRRTITETDRWIQSNDTEAVRSQVSQLDPILANIDGLLDRAVKSSVPEGGGTP